MTKIFARAYVQIDLLEIRNQLESDIGSVAANTKIAAIVDLIESLSTNPEQAQVRSPHETSLEECRMLVYEAWVVLYVYDELADTVDVYRVVHGARDLPNLGFDA